MSTTTKAGDPPTDQQMKVFLFIYETTRDLGYQPSLRQVAAHFGWYSPNGVIAHIKPLQRKGWIARDDEPGGGRSLRFLRTPSGAPFTGFADKEDA